MIVNAKYLANHAEMLKVIPPILRTAEGNYNLNLKEDRGETRRFLYATISQEDFRILCGKIGTQQHIREDK